MKLWQKLVLLNLAGLAGLVSSMFIVPGDTPFYVWLVVAAGVLAALNLAFVVGRRRTKAANSSMTAEVKLVVVIGTGIWILDLLAHVLRR